MQSQSSENAPLVEDGYIVYLVSKRLRKGCPVFFLFQRSKYEKFEES